MDIPMAKHELPQPEAPVPPHILSALGKSRWRPDLPPPRVATLPRLTVTTADDGSPQNYRLTRTYSETETNNFDADTGHRLFDDGRIRTKPSRASSPARPPYFDTRSHDTRPHDETPPKLYSRSHDELIDRDASAFTGLEDEYIPGLDFSDVLLRWNAPADSAATSHTNSRDALYLDLNQLHAKVAPQPIQFKMPFQPAFLDDPIKKKLKLLPKPAEVSYEAVIASLPSNFLDLPYSQRMKLVKNFSDLIDYPQFSLFAKNYFSNKFSVGLTGSGRTYRSDPMSIAHNGSFTRRSRRNSANTVAGRLLALSLTVDLKKLDKPKKNIDERGAYVLDHQLGKVIGFGAWGTIRECVARDGTVRAVKIVKSTRDTDRAKLHNPKVLRVFRQEITIWLQMHHPNILPLLDHVEADDVIFCLTNRIGGGTLFEVVSRWGIFNEGVESTSGPLNFRLDRQARRLHTTANFTAQIASALEYMHSELGIVHGDLKLENVLVDDLDSTNVRMILCDFGMSRVYAPRISRKLLRLGGDDATAMARSKSSMPAVRRPYTGDSHSTRALFADDSKIGVLNLLRTHGPSLQSLDFTPTHSASSSLLDFHEYNTKDNNLGSEIDSDLPHLHIGLLPYASPELLSPLPPPLGPLADIWALGVLVFTMIVGKLPFQHNYEPRLRAIITAGKYDRRESRQAALMEWIAADNESLAGSFVDVKRATLVAAMKSEWENSDHAKYAWVDDLISGCLERDITRRWDLDTVVAALDAHCEDA